MGKEYNNLSNLFSYLQSKDINENILVALRYALSKYFKEKTVVNGKMLTQMFDNIGFAKAYKHLRYENLKRVFVSSNYAILQFNFKAKSYYGETDRMHFYLIGVNSETGRLWIEKIAFAPSNYYEMIFLNINGKSIDVVLTREREIQFYVLGYNYDLDLNGLEKLRLSKGVAVRVQGDIIMRIEEIGRKAEHDYICNLETAIARALDDILEIRTIRKVMDILQSYGLNARVIGNEILIPCIRANETESNILKRIITIAKLVYDKLDLSKEIKELRLRNVGKHLYVEKEKSYWSYDERVVISYKWMINDMVKLTFRSSRTRAFGVESYDSVSIRIDTSHLACLDKAERIVKELKKNGVLDYVESKIRIGRHLVKALTKPLALTIETEVFGEKVTFRVTNLPIVARDKIEFIHPEHLKKTLKLIVPVEIRFDTIPEDQRFHERVNKYIMDYLVEKYGKDIDIEVKEVS